MNWHKKGLIIEPTGDPWMKTHAMIPVAEHRHGDIYRVYFSGRDDQNRSHVSYAELDITAPDQSVTCADGPVLGLGDLGCFDDNGVTPSWIVDHDDKKYLYYIGWNAGSTVRMHLYGGLAISTDGGESFRRHSRVPLLERIHEEPFLNTAPCVLQEGPKDWKMWYVAGITWIDPDLPKYNIRYAESEDGIHWDRPGTVAIDFKNENEQALARPCVLKENGTYKMWYSYKGEDYSLGYAESENGVNWNRMDSEVGISVSDDGFDSRMIEYAYVFDHKGRKYMLYNGNDYGYDGVGLAVGSTDSDSN